MPRIGSIVGAGIAVSLALMAIAGCTSSGEQKPVAVDPNLYPANYKSQVVDLLRTTLTDRAEFFGALIAPPALRSVGDSQRYVVCLQFNGPDPHKAVIYFSGTPTQFIDADPAECDGAAYQPFPELAQAAPRTH